MIRFTFLCLSMLVIFSLKGRASDLYKEPVLFKNESSFPPLYYREAIKAINLQKKEKREEEFETPKIYLKVKSIHESETLRTIKLNIVTSSPDFFPLEQERKKRKLKKNSISKVRLGKVVLLENPFLLEHKGAFHLDFLYIFENFQGKGLGSRTLTELKKLAEQLKMYSPFYSTMTLVSQDVDYKGLPLPVVPRRVKFYMDNGFQLHPKTINLIKFLDIKHFIDQFDEHQFASYLCDYILPSPLMKEAEALASYILPALQNSPSFSSEPFADLLERVKTDGSLCAKHILDRAYYAGNGITDEEQETFVKYVYMMTYSSNRTLIQDAEAISTSRQTGMKDFLQEKCEWKNFSLLPDQNKLNQEIDHLIKTPPLYKDVTGQKKI